MTIIDHRPKSGANSSNATSNNRELTAELWVESDDPEDTGHAVVTYLIAQGYTYGAAYNVGNDDLTSRSPINTALYQMDAPQLAPGSATMWSVMLHYRLVTREFQTATGQLAENPLVRRAKMSLSSVPRNMALKKAIYRGGLDTSVLGWEIDKERRITNSAGKDVYPIPEQEVQGYILRITRNFAAVTVNNTTFPETWINSTSLEFYDGLLKVNVSSYELKMLSWNINPRFEENAEFLEVTFEGEIKRGVLGWRYEFLDVGYMERSVAPASLSHVKMLDDNGQPSAEPMLLDGSGFKLADQQAGQERYGRWSGYKELDIRTTPFFAGIVT